MSDPLVAFLRAAAERPFFLPEWNCGRFCAAWVELRRGRDPGADWWGRFETPLGLARILKRRGGLVAHFDGCLTAIGMRRTNDPRRGDLAVVLAPEGETGAILIGDGMSVCAGDRRLFFRRLPVLAAWGI